MKTFQEMNLPESLMHTLAHIGFDSPTPIQSESIPVALDGSDILGSAQTGTGKTGAFGIPLVARMLSNPDSCSLVVTPTRELATQVIKQIRSMVGNQSPIKASLLIGGEFMPKQLNQLRNNKPRIIVGTPGRINDHLERGSLSLEKTDFLVLDETDLMLDLGFTVQIDNIMDHLSSNRQTLLFSATMPKKISIIAQKYLNNPHRISLDSASPTSNNVTQENIKTTEQDKYANLIDQINKREGSIIIFVKTKHGTEKLAKSIAKDGHSVNAIHGDLRQNKRDRVISSFRAKKYRILVATDVAARGLDIPHIEHVINYDIPQCAEDYIHRIGRTARAGSQGQALNFISPSDSRKWAEIDRFLNPNSTYRNEKHSNDRNGRRNNNFRFRENGHSKPFARNGYVRNNKNSYSSKRNFD